MDNQEFPDENILKKREEKLKKEYATLEDGIYLQGNIMTFKREEILDLFLLMIPTNFEIMPEEYANVKYPSTFRPQHLLTSEDLTVNMGFSVFPNNLQADMKQTLQRVKQTLENEQDAFSFSESTPIKDIEGYYFEFRQQAIDGDLYHMMALVKKNQNLYQLSFNCLFSDQLDWQNIALQMWESIDFIKDKGGARK